MILPLIAAYFLFAWISSFNDEQGFTEYLDNTGELQEVMKHLDDPQLYYPKIAKDEADKLANKERSIVLYNQDGIVIYSSYSGLGSTQYSVGKDELFKGLYRFEQGFSTYDYKQPVFDGNTLVGFFQLELARDEWTKGVSDRSLLMLGIFIVVFALIYLSVVRFVNRKLNRRLTGLMDEMTAFAQGEVIEETEANNDEIGQLKRHFYTMRNQINIAQEVIGKEQQGKEYMVATISHDLKTPLTSIKAYTEAIENEAKLTPEEQTEYRKVVIEKADFMKEMLDDLLTYTLLQSPTYEMDFVQVDGNEFFDMLISDYEALCKKKSIELHAFANVKGPYKVNPKQMMRIADNLMANAIQHTEHGHQILIAAISQKESIEELLFPVAMETSKLDFNNYAYLIVQNEGAGIAQHNIRKLLDPLYQADEARSKQADHGTGLGLSITEQIITKHGGDVEIYSKENMGTTVICRLPKIKGVNNDENS